MPSVDYDIGEEYIDGALTIGDPDKLVLTFRSPPPSEWTDKYDATVEEIEGGRDAYGVKIHGQELVEAFIAWEIPAFREYIQHARRQFGGKGGVLRLGRTLLLDTESEKQDRLKKFRGR